MYNQDTELLFPPRAIAGLQNIRGEQWHNLVGLVLLESSETLEKAAFVLMMVRMGGCATCSSDSYRAMRGCNSCSSQTIRRFRGSDDDLLRFYNDARTDMEKYTPGFPPPRHRIPIAIIAGSWDTIAPPAGARRLAAALPGSRLRFLLHSGHSGAYSRPRAYARMVLEELERMELR